jgi:hypothetical protein
MVPAGYAHLMVPMEGILSYTAYGRYTLLYIITRCCSGVKERCCVAAPVSHSVAAELCTQRSVFGSIAGMASHIASSREIACITEHIGSVQPGRRMRLGRRYGISHAHGQVAAKLPL